MTKGTDRISELMDEKKILEERLEKIKKELRGLVYAEQRKTIIVRQD